MWRIANELVLTQRGAENQARLSEGFLLDLLVHNSSSKLVTAKNVSERLLMHEKQLYSSQ